MAWPTADDYRAMSDQDLCARLFEIPVDPLAVKVAYGERPEVIRLERQTRSLLCDMEANS